VSIPVLSIATVIEEKSTVEKNLRDSEQRLGVANERLNLAMESGSVGGWDYDLVSGRDIWFGKTSALLGIKADDYSRTTQEFWDRVHPDDRNRLQDTLRNAESNHTDFTEEFRVVWGDGSVHWLRSTGEYRYDANGKAERMLGISIDITQRKRSEDALADMTRKLIEAQEQERARIGRELHDDINQRLAMLAVELEHLKENPSEIESRVQELRKQTAEISNDVQGLSHDLHSSKLEYLGVVAGMKSWCREFGERQKLEIDYRHDVRSSLPAEIGLCLFRVLQEALHNAAKHSGVKRVEVQLREEPGEIHFIVSDLGRGFDVEAVKQGKGLGLISMRERVRLVNGTISIESKPMAGTTVHVRVPLESKYGSQRAAL
jgi:PAS domain S-box-containing protein